MTSCPIPYVTTRTNQGERTVDVYSRLLFGIRTLRDGDRFNIINFAGEEHLMERGLIAANAQGKKRGEEFVAKLRPSGGTNINDSLIASMKQFEKSDRPFSDRGRNSGMAGSP